MITHLTFKVQGMRCAACANVVETALRSPSRRELIITLPLSAPIKKRQSSRPCNAKEKVWPWWEMALTMPRLWLRPM